MNRIYPRVPNLLYPVGFENSVTSVEAVLSWRPGSVGDSRPLEVTRAVVACVRGRSPSVRAGGAPLSVARVEGPGDPRAAARTLDLAPPDAATAAARRGPAIAHGAKSRSPSTRVDGLLGQSAHAAALAPAGWWRAAGRTPIGGQGGHESMPTCKGWCFGLRARTQPGATGGSLVSFADSASRSPRVLSAQS